MFLSRGDGRRCALVRVRFLSERVSVPRVLKNTGSRGLSQRKCYPHSQKEMWLRRKVLRCSWPAVRSGCWVSWRAGAQRSSRAGCEIGETGSDGWKSQLWLGGVRDWNSGYGGVSGHSGPGVGGSPCLDI